MVSHFIPEPKDDFLNLFPHRHDFLKSPHPLPGESPQWVSENRYPLSDRMILQGSQLYGVRFGAYTEYLLIDIDISSPYHPIRDRNAIPEIMRSLEPLGICSWMATTSSYSGGLHIYIPLGEPIKSWQIAAATAALLENSGFPLQGGQLEIFPHVKEFGQADALYNGHRLPLQSGSYLITSASKGNWEPETRDHNVFVSQWKFCQSKNDVTERGLKQALKLAKRKRYQVSGKANQFLNDLNADIEPGWTDYGQTNRLLGRIALRSYVFGHIVNGCSEFVTGTTLINEIVRVATSLPGYADYCRHQSEIEDRAAEWADCVESSRYFPYRSKREKPELELEPELEKISPNEQRLMDARSRIAAAIGRMLESGTLAPGAKARFLALVASGIGGGTLYKHRDLWHPAYLWKSPPAPPQFAEVDRSELALGSSEAPTPPSLLGKIASNQPSEGDHSSFVTSQNWITASNQPSDNDCSDLEPESDYQLRIKRFMEEYADQLARISSYLRCLHDLDSNGEWANDPLIEMWRSSRFEMSGQAINALADYLQGYYKSLDTQALDYAAWESNHIAEGGIS